MPLLNQLSMLLTFILKQALLFFSLLLAFRVTGKHQSLITSPMSLLIIFQKASILTVMEYTHGFETTKNLILVA